jgi:hypothetical protein
MIETIFASGVIEDAPSLASLLTRVLGFLLEVFGIIAILGVILVGAMYFFVSDDKKEILRAKKAFFHIVIGVVAALAAVVIVRQITGYFL